MHTHKTALVLGATGGIGSEVTQQLCDAGWKVRALKRGPTLPSERGDHRITWLCGDAIYREDIMAAAKGCSVIVHAVNPPCNNEWADLALSMLDNTIAAAIAQRATIILPSTIYSYGTNAFPILREDSPQQPQTHKSAIRVELERRLEAASTRGCRVIIVRAGDFFGPKMSNSWFTQAMVKPGRVITTVNLLGDKGAGHQWSYLPDAARTMVLLLEKRASLEPFTAFHLAGHWDSDGTKMAQAIINAVVWNGGAQPKVKKFPWWLISLVSPINETFRELSEMRYMWKKPIRMSNERLIAVLGHEPHTPLKIAVHATLEGMGCLKTAR